TEFFLVLFELTHLTLVQKGEELFEQRRHCKVLLIRHRRRDQRGEFKLHTASLRIAFVFFPGALAAKIFLRNDQHDQRDQTENRDKSESQNFENDAFQLHLPVHFFAFNNSTGTETSCRTLSAVLPYKISLINRCPCVVIAMRSTCSSAATLMISFAGSPSA